MQQPQDVNAYCPKLPAQMNMKTPTFAFFLILIFGLYNPVLADDDDRYLDKRHWWGGEWKNEHQEGACEVKTESKSGEYKREIKCKDGIGAWWHGDWKREFMDGPCKIKQEAKRDEFKEEVKCD